MTVITSEELGPDLAERLGRLGRRPSRDDVLDRMPMPLPMPMPMPMPRRDMPRPMPRRDMPDMPRRGGGDKIDLSKLLDRLRGRSPKPRGPIGRTPDMPTRPSPKSKTIEDIFKGRSGRRTRPPESKRSPQEMMDMLRDRLSGGMPGKVTRMNEGGEAMSPLEILYGQIGVADESGARDVIEKILSGRSSELTEDQRALTNSGIYRRVANRLGILDRAGNPISAGSSVATDAGRTYTPTIGRALQTLSEMESAESGSGIESLLKQILGYNPNEEATGGAYRQAIEASGFPGFMAGGGGGQPMPEQPNKGYAGYGGQGTSYGGNYGNPEYKGYFGEAPAMPYAGMSSPNPSLSNIIGMAPVNYFGMADVVGKDKETGGGTAS